LSLGNSELGFSVLQEKQTAESAMNPRLAIFSLAFLFIERRHGLHSQANPDGSLLQI